MENEVPNVSIIIPNYNHAPFLKQRLESVFQQSFQDFEVILLDDASTDDSVKLLQQYANHPKVSHFIINENNSGSPFKQWAKGIKLAKGTYIWIAESDDWAELTFLEQLLPLVEQEKVGLAFCNSHWVDLEGVIGKSLSIHNTSFLKDGHTEIAENLVYRNSIQNVSSVLFKRIALEVCSERYTAFRVAGDWWLYTEILLQWKVVFLENRLNYFRWYHSNTSNKTLGQGVWTTEGIAILSLIGNKVKLTKTKLYSILWKWTRKSLSFYKRTNDTTTFLRLLKKIYRFKIAQLFQ